MQSRLSKKAIIFILLMSMIFTLNAITTILYTGVSSSRIVGDDREYGYYNENWDLRMGGHHIGLTFNNSEQGMTPILESGIRFDQTFITIPTKVKISSGAIEPYAGLSVAIRYPHHEVDNDDYGYYERWNLSDFHFGYTLGLDYVNNDQLWFVGVEYFRSFTKAYTIEFEGYGPYGNPTSRSITPEWYVQTISISIGLLF